MKYTKQIIIYIFFPLMSIIFFIALCIIIVLNTPSIRIDLSADGFVNFEKWFSLPLTILAFSVPIWGILVAILKYKQTERHFNKHYELQAKDIKVNNYYKHMEEYLSIIESMKSDFTTGDKYKMPRILMSDSIQFVNGDSDIKKIKSSPKYCVNFILL
jgi:hypothetical protein